jgi:hypothetical protein
MKRLTYFTFSLPTPQTFTICNGNIIANTGASVDFSNWTVRLNRTKLSIQFNSADSILMNTLKRGCMYVYMYRVHKVEFITVTCGNIFEFNPIGIHIVPRIDLELRGNIVLHRHQRRNPASVTVADITQWLWTWIRGYRHPTASGQTRKKLHASCAIFWCDEVSTSDFWLQMAKV